MGSQNMHLFIQEDFSFEIRLEVLHFGPDLLLDHCIEGDTQLVQLGLQGGQVHSLLQKTGMSGAQTPVAFQPTNSLFPTGPERGWY